MSDILDRIKENLNKPEVQEAFKKWKAHQDFLDELLNEHLAWFDSIGPERRNKYINKIINKYKSDAYKDRWYNRGIFPPEDLYWFIYDYAYKYGKCWKALSEEVGPGYDSKFVFDNWKVILYNGQGSVIHISHITDADIEKGPDEYAQHWLGHEYEFPTKEYYETLTDEFE